MIRESLLKKEEAVRNGFRLRGLGEVSRIEALSDGVIAFAITRRPNYIILAGMVYWLIAPFLTVMEAGSIHSTHNAKTASTTPKLMHPTLSFDLKMRCINN
jgi:hypothetical protein